MGLGFGVLLAIIVGALIVGALILMLATRVVEKFTPSFGKALVTQIVIGIAGVIVSIVLRLVVHGLTGSVVAAVVNFFVAAWIIQQLITPPGGEVANGGAMAVAADGKMGYGRACLIGLVEYLIALVFGVILGIVFGGTIMAALHH